MAFAFQSDWLKECKDWMREHAQGKEIDERLTQILGGVVDHVERNLWGTLIERKTRTVQPDYRRGDRVLTLEAAPVKRVDSVTYDWERGFTDIDPLDASLYYVDKDAGQVVFDAPILIDKAGTIQVVYSGGLAGDFAALKTGFPRLVQGIVMWAADWYDRRSRLTARERRSGAGLGVVELNVKPPPAALELIGRRYRVRAS